MINLSYIKSKIELVQLNSPYILIIIIILILPLWILEWGPLNLKINSEQINPPIVNLDKNIEIYNPNNLKPKPAPLLQRIKTVRINSGDTLMDIFTAAGLRRAEAYEAIASLSKIYNPRNILPGQQIKFTFQPNSKENRVADFSKQNKILDIIYRPNLYHEYKIILGKHNRFKTTLYKLEIRTKVRRILGTINSSLYLSATKSGLPIPVLMELIRIYSWDIDFQRSIRSGDKFEVLFERIETNSGKLARYGNILYANLKLGKLSNPLYLFKKNNKIYNHFDEKGHSAKKALMRTPINGARLSSGYGTRRHPILGYNKMHRGVDFAAPIGTPILAAGSGTIVFRSRNGAYGNYIRIRHNSLYSTAYAHLSKFNRSLTKGSRVRQGQVIGYVGTTGRSTGAHLHYEILKRGRQTNPRRVKMPSGTRLGGADLHLFKKTKDRLKTLLQNVKVSNRVEKKLNSQIP